MPYTTPRPHHDALADEPAIAALDGEHERIEQMLDVLRGLVPRLTVAQTPDARCRADAARIVELFDGDEPAHRAREERLLFPVLRRLGGRGGIALAARLEAEHDLIARGWSQSRPAMADLAAGGPWAAESAPLEFERWRDFVILVTTHMLAEHGAAFPTALALLRGAPPLA
ncbi:MAG: hemerythrin domain-containing protein [Rubrivivax sp.]|nr:hemerythrin domain-containing protein [Rubrivivax sp.]MCL4698368.1 hemerythrin domain-containing protein [Burkholderiaceae bacterium]